MSQKYLPFEHLSALYIGEMGRGRRGPVEQSTKKPKTGKNKNVEILKVYYNTFPQNCENNKPLITESLISEMKKMSPQDLMDILIGH